MDVSEVEGELRGRGQDHGEALDQEVDVQKHRDRDQTQQATHDGGIQLERKKGR